MYGIALGFLFSTHYLIQVSFETCAGVLSLVRSLLRSRNASSALSQQSVFRKYSVLLGGRQKNSKIE